MNSPWKVREPRQLRGELPLNRHYRDQVQAALIALFCEDRLFLVQGRRSGEWQLPGGRVDATDAHIWEAATREFYEETGSLAPLPACNLLGWFESTISLSNGAPYKGVIVVVQTGVPDIPFQENNETRACSFVRWSELDQKIFRWPNNATIPLIHEYSLPRVDGPGIIKRGPWSDSRPTLQCGTGKCNRCGQRCGLRCGEDSAGKCQRCGKDCGLKCSEEPQSSVVLFPVENVTKGQNAPQQKQEPSA